MLLSITATVLKPILSALAKVIDQKDLMPIRSNLYLHQDEEGRVIATVSSESHALHYVLPFDAVQDFSPICIPFAQLTDITSAIGESIFPMEIRTGANAGSKNPYEVVIDYGEGEFRFIAEDPAGYPMQKITDETFRCQVPARTVFAAASCASGFTSKDDLRPVIQSVCLDFRADGSCLRVVASDTRSLFCRTIGELTIPDNQTVVISSRTIGIANACFGKDGEVTVSVNGRFLTISNDNCRLESVIPDGRYPAYEKVIPKSNPYTVDFSASAFSTAVRRAEICANSATGQVNFNFEPGQTYVKISASDVELSKSGHTSLVLKNPEQVTSPVAIGFRASLLINAVSAIGTSNIIMSYSEPNRAAVLESPDHVTLVMVMPSLIV